MYSNIKQLRKAGVRRSDHEIGGDTGVFGELRLATVGDHRQLRLFAWGDSSHMVPLIPILFDASLITMHGHLMLFRGFQRDGAANDRRAPTYLQEWTVSWIGERPPADGQAT